MSILKHYLPISTCINSSSNSATIKAASIIAAAATASSSILLSPFLKSSTTSSDHTTTTAQSTITRTLSTEKDIPSSYPVPNQITSTYTKMQSHCPQVIKAYAQCVISKQNEGVLQQGGCEEEYVQLMDCFRRVRV